jgi:1,4-dihydroxy-2-naphthoate octaprenyltransferase
VLAFALVGFGLSAAYVGGRWSLKFLGLGELAVFLVWGPLMIGGTYLVLTGRIPWPVLLAAAPYGLLVTTVILGKHYDKYEADRGLDIGTLPVRLGLPATRALIGAFILAFYLAVVGLAAAGMLGWGTCLTLFSLGRAYRVWKILLQPRPPAAPEQWPVWPLWYVGYCFYLVRLAGGLFLLGWLMEFGVRALWPLVF